MVVVNLGNKIAIIATNLIMIALIGLALMLQDNINNYYKQEFRLYQGQNKIVGTDKSLNETVMSGKEICESAKLLTRLNSKGYGVPYFNMKYLLYGSIIVEYDELFDNILEDSNYKLTYLENGVIQMEEV